MLNQEDEVVRELDLILTDNLNLHVLQFPLKPVYSDFIDINSARVKPINHKLSISVPLSSDVLESIESMQYDTYAVPKVQTMESSTVAHHVSLAVAVVHDNKVHLAPLESVWQMRPSFKSTSLVDAVIKDSDEEETAAGEAPEGLQQIQLKRKESERSYAARIQSYTHLQMQEDKEPWEELCFHAIGTYLRAAVVHLLYLSAMLLLMSVHVVLFLYVVLR
jgi:hypothetical protein